jgi:transcriptional regulator with XRE-family HTH domain
VTDLSFADRIGQAIRRARKAKGWTQTDLAGEVTRLRRLTNGKAPEASLDTISRIERGDNATTDMLEEIAQALGTTVFNLGFGAWSSREKPPGSDADFIPVLQEDEASPQVISWDDHGAPLWAVQQWGSRPADVRDPKAYIFVIRDDSMEPYYKRGWRAIVSPSKPVGDGDIVCVHLASGERLIKVAHREAEGWLFESYNPAYKPRLVRDEEVSMIHCVVYVRTLKEGERMPQP